MCFRFASLAVVRFTVDTTIPKFGFVLQRHNLRQAPRQFRNKGYGQNNEALPR